MNKRKNHRVKIEGLANKKIHPLGESREGEYLPIDGSKDISEK